MRRRWIILAACVTALGATGFALLGPFGEEPFPLADLVPADALVYVGLPDASAIDRLPAAWTESFRADLEEARPFLAGALAVYVDREGEWVALARLRRASTMVAEGRVELDGDAAVIAESPAALRRHRGRTAVLAHDPAFRSLGRRIFINLEPLGLPGRLGDFSSAGFDLEDGPPWSLSGVVAYRRGMRRRYLDRYVHRPRTGVPAGGGCALAQVTLDPVRIHEEILAPLSSAERKGVAHYLRTLSEELLADEPFESFLERIGPGVGFRVVPGDPPGIVAWVELADEATRDRVEQVLRRCIPDIERLGTRDKGLPYVKVTAFEDPLWRLEFPRLVEWKPGPSFDPVCTFDENRFVLASRPDLLPAPVPAAGAAHVAVELELAPARKTYRHVGDRVECAPSITGLEPLLDELERVHVEGRYSGEGLLLRIRLDPRR